MGLNGRVCHEASALLLFVSLALTTEGGFSQPCFSSGDIFVCRGQNLSAMPAELSDLTWRLDLSFNVIPSLNSSWTSRPLLRLEVLVLAQNALVTVAPGAFVDTPHLRHLDLSSNRLESLNEGAFRGLGELEELLLFDNHLRQISSGWAFEGLGGNSLRRLHLGRNRLTEFPRDMFESVAASAAAGSLSEPRVFDLSSNLLREVPVAYILSLPPQTQAAIYLHDNPLVCTCAVSSMLQQWADQSFRMMVGFQQGHACLSGSVKDRVNCSLERPNSAHPIRVLYEAKLGEWLLLSCLESVEQRRSSVRWGTPDQVTSPGVKEHLFVHPNGTLEIQGVREEDAGTYSCTVVSGELQGAVKVVEVIVSDNQVTTTPERGGNFHTAFTAMASSMVSMLLLVVYLYFSPCHCHRRQTSVTKRVVFVEPWMEVTAPNAAHLSAGTADPVATRGILKNGGPSSAKPPIKEICPLI
ncbi:hypothetical protein ACEWY4_001809 [Coilia grayii]|uniref:Ig-like domain-containing protein n=1 Tax=Coilia grayii TaxID=363190 RepID=A0ABD1KU09_9TELE